MKAVTIDNLDLKDHLRWAQDQTVLDTIFVTEAQEIAHHPEIMGMSIIYPSKFDELFELQKRNQHWAAFTPPKNYQLLRKRLFSYRLFPSIHWEDSEQDAEDFEEENPPEPNLISTISDIQPHDMQTPLRFEKDKNTMLNMLESIQWINKLLLQINARKLQYQKG
jgi:hypothetical protein